MLSAMRNAASPIEDNFNTQTGIVLLKLHDDVL